MISRELISAASDRTRRMARPPTPRAARWPSRAVDKTSGTNISGAEIRRSDVRTTEELAQVQRDEAIDLASSRRAVNNLGNAARRASTLRSACCPAVMDSVRSTSSPPRSASSSGSKHRGRARTTQQRGTGSLIAQLFPMTTAGPFAATEV